jgi:hypothetical protein
MCLQKAERRGIQSTPRNTYFATTTTTTTRILLLLTHGERKEVPEVCVM